MSQPVGVAGTARVPPAAPGRRGRRCGRCGRRAASPRRAGGAPGVSRKTVQRWEGGARAPDPGAETALLRYCREAGLFRAYDRGPLTGLDLTAERLRRCSPRRAGAWRPSAPDDPRRADGGAAPDDAPPRRPPPDARGGPPRPVPANLPAP